MDINGKNSNSTFKSTLEYEKKNCIKCRGKFFLKRQRGLERKYTGEQKSSLKIANLCR